MLANIIINVPVPQDGASPFLEEEDARRANELIHCITWISGLNDIKKQAVTQFLLCASPNLFRLQDVTEVSTVRFSDIQPLTASYLQTPPNDTHMISNTPQVSSLVPAISNMPCDTTESDHDVSGHNGNDHRTYMEFLREVVSTPYEDYTVPGDNLHILRELKEAKENTDTRYHPALEIMLNYEGPNSAFDSKTMAPAIRAGHAIIRSDLKAFTEGFLSNWLLNGLWPVPINTSPSTQSNYNIDQCSKEMEYLGFQKGPETVTIIRRIARIRLYYWYKNEMTRMRNSEFPMELNRGVRISTRAIDAFLETTASEKKENTRKQFHNEKKIGKRWCELVQYLGEGILVICGKEMDTQMNSSNFPTRSVHALATFVINCFPEARNISSSFNLAVKAFIRKESIEEQELVEWKNQLDWEFIENIAKKVEDSPHQPASWTTVPDCSDSDLTNFIWRALACNERS